MAFNPKEPRDPHSGKWTLEGIMSDIGALSQGGQGNRTTMRGIEVRRHQSGEVRVKIRGDARKYASHEEAARAVHAQSHTSAGVRHDAAREAVVSGAVPSAGYKPPRQGGGRTDMHSMARQYHQQSLDRSAARDRQAREMLARQVQRDSAHEQAKAKAIKAYRIQNMSVDEMQHELNANRLTAQEIADEMQRRSKTRVEAENAARGGGTTIYDFKVEPGQVNSVNLGSILADPNTTLSQLRQAESMVSSSREYTASGRAALLRNIRAKIRAKETANLKKIRGR